MCKLFKAKKKEVKKLPIRKLRRCMDCIHIAKHSFTVEWSFCECPTNKKIYNPINGEYQSLTLCGIKNHEGTCADFQLRNIPSV